MAKGKRPPLFHRPEIWAEAKRDYLDGMTAPQIEVRHGIRRNALRQRQKREGWTRRDAWAEARATLAAETARAARAAPEAPPPTRVEQIAGLDIAEAALMQALLALKQGRAADAAALIKAGDAVGEFAEFVADKRRAER